jgi:hypothetical protein
VDSSIKSIVLLELFLPDFFPRIRICTFNASRQQYDNLLILKGCFKTRGLDGVRQMTSLTGDGMMFESESRGTGAAFPACFGMVAKQKGGRRDRRPYEIRVKSSAGIARLGVTSAIDTGSIPLLTSPLKGEGLEKLP